MFQQVGKVMLVAGLVLAALGGAIWALGKLGLTRLPGDLSFQGKTWRLYVPLGACVLLSILLSLLMWALSRIRR